MSLINDALKKAQKQRTGESPDLSALPSVGGESAHRIAKRANPAGFNSLLLRLGLGAVVVVAVIGGYFLLRSGARKPAPVAVTMVTPAVNPEATITTASAPKTITTVPGSPPSSAPTFVLPIAPAPTVAKSDRPAATATPKPGPKPPVATAAAAAPAPPPVEAPKPAGPPAKLEPRAVTYIENIRVAGIRASATDSKVLMNDRVYRVGDTVEHELGLKVIGITSSSLTFEDENGGRYTRNF